MSDDAPPLASSDPYSPTEMAARVEAAGVREVNQSHLNTLVLAVLAGAFIAFGGMLFTLVVTESSLGFGPTRLLGGLAFSLGLILVIIGGAELFTGNSLIVMAWADRRITTRATLANWGVVYLGNLIGSVACVALFYLSGLLALGDGAVANTAITIAQSKVQLGLVECLVRGILCNVLVCLAVWLSYASHSVSGKVLAIVFPVTAFVALGFEHSIANMYLIPLGMLAESGRIDVAAFVGNLVPVTVGNMIGGGFLVAFVYWFIYLRESSTSR